MKILLTGGTGYLGGSLLRGLLESGHQLTVLTRRPRDEGGGSQLRWLKGDLLDGPPPAQEVGAHRAVIHSAAMVKTWSRDRGEFDRTNVAAYGGLLDRCAQAGVSKVIHTSSFLALGPSPGPEPITEADRRERDRFYTDYERTKYLADLETDRWIEKGLPIISLYPSVLFGPGHRTDGNLVGKMIYWIRTGRFPGMVGPGTQVWNYAYVPDVVRGHLAALDRGLPGRRYVLGGENRSLRDVLLSIHRFLDLPFKVRRIPIPVAEGLGMLMEWGAWITGKAPDLTRGVAGVYREHWSYSSATAERELSYRITPFAEALGRTVEWVRGLDRWEES